MSGIFAFAVAASQPWYAQPTADFTIKAAGVVLWVLIIALGMRACLLGQRWKYIKLIFMSEVALGAILLGIAIIGLATRQPQFSAYWLLAGALTCIIAAVGIVFARARQRQSELRRIQATDAVENDSPRAH